ncbi:MAG: FtsW/RodA/SpoVE family cell cycle protein [Clostridiaceae bacterium]|nr:FtsW/RodA/SpoVE family cell cycle protein [Clostridiaceae bacterium]
MKKDRILALNAARNRDIQRISTVNSVMQPTRRLHSGLLVVTLIMICFGLVMLFSASMSDGYASYAGDSMYYVIKQSGITAIGLVIALIVAILVPIGLFDHFWMSLVLYGVTTVLLVYVKFFGILMNGARRWVYIGMRFQPSELAKLALVFCFASYCSMLKRQRRAGKLRFRTPLRQFIMDGWLDILIPGFAILIWIGLIVWQPHVSCAIIMCFITAVLYLTAGIRIRSWISGVTQALILVLVLALLVAMILPLLPQGNIQETIQKNFAHVGDRINTFLNPDEAEEDDTYQITQSLIAIGSGGLSGVGLGEGRQKYNYLPEAHNDFVFAIIGEELGFVGTTAVLLLFVIFMLIGVSITRNAANSFTALLAGGYTMLISIQAFLNIAVATRTIPSTGISLPFFSYGGTSNMFFLMAIGFILAVSRSGQRIPRTAGSSPTAETQTEPEPDSREWQPELAGYPGSGLDQTAGGIRTGYGDRS